MKNRIKWGDESLMENGLKTLYCFKLHESGEIEKIEIPEWHTTRWNTGRFVISFDSNVAQINKYDKRYFLDSNKLDRFVTNKLFTFDGDETRAREKIKKTLSERLINASDECDKNMRALSSITRREKDER